MNTTQLIPAEWRAARRILAVRLDNLGDVLVTTPAIHAIKQSLPEAKITLLASPIGAQAAALNPDISDVVVYQSPQMDPWRKLPQDSEREQRMIALLRERGFDAAIIFTSFRQSSLPQAYLCYLADIPLRLAASIDGPGSLLTTRHKHPERMMHEVERGLDLVGVVGFATEETNLVLRVTTDLRVQMADYVLPDGSTLRARLPLNYTTTPAPLLEQAVGAQVTTGVHRSSFSVQHSAFSSPLVVLHPGCSMPARTYPWQLFAEAADLLIEQLGAQVVITGSAEERPLVERIQAQMRHKSLALAGELSFPLFCALIEAADLTITNNTGPMHVSAAVQTPVVALFALTNPPQQWGPWRVPHRLLYRDVSCRMCYSRECPFGHECLRLVSPAMVLEAASELLGSERVPVPQTPIDRELSSSPLSVGPPALMQLPPQRAPIYGD